MYWLACNWYNSIIIKSFLAPLRSAVLQFTAKLTTAHNTLANAYFLLLQEAKVGCGTVALQSEKFECATVDLQFLTCQKVANYDCRAKAIARDEILCYNNLFLLWICIYYPFLINQLISGIFECWYDPCTSFVFVVYRFTTLNLLFMDKIRVIHCWYTLFLYSKMCYLHRHDQMLFYLLQFIKHVLYLLLLPGRHCCTRSYV